MQNLIWPNSLSPLNPLGYEANIFSKCIVITGTSGAGGGGAPAGGAEFPQIFAMTSGSIANNANITLDVPAETQVGDFLLTCLSYDSFTAIPFSNYGAASGWNLIADNEEAITCQLWIWKFAEAADIGASYTFTAGSASTRLGTMLAISGVNTSNPIGRVKYGPDDSNQMDNFDPLSTTNRYYGRNGFITMPGLQGMNTYYDKSLVVVGLAMEGDQNDAQGLSEGWQQVQKQKSSATMGLTIGYYNMPDVGMCPARTIQTANSDNMTVVGMVLNPATLAQDTVPSVPYIYDFWTRFNLGPTWEMQVPSGTQAGDLLTVIVWAGAALSLTDPQCTDDVSGPAGWTRHIFDVQDNLTCAIWSKVAAGSESIINYDSQSAGTIYHQSAVLGVRNATSGVLEGASGVSPFVTATSIIGPAIPLNADGTLVVHTYGTRGAGNNNILGQWDATFPTSAPAMSGIVTQASQGAAGAIATAIGCTPNATGSGVDGPTWLSLVSQPLTAVGFSIY